MRTTTQGWTGQCRSATRLRLTGGAAALGLMTALAACGQESFVEDAPPASAPPTAQPTEEPTAEATEEPTAEPTPEPTAEPTAGGGEVVLEAGAVGGVELPAPPEEVREALVQEWGEPDVQEQRRGCPLGDPDTQMVLMSWGGVTVYGEYVPDEEPMIDVWTVTAQGPAPDSLTTPLEIVPGTPWTQAVDVVPGGQTEPNPLDPRTEILVSEERLDLTWTSSQDVNDAPEQAAVAAVAWNQTPCE